MSLAAILLTSLCRRSSRCSLGSISPISCCLLGRFWHERLRRVVANALHDPEALGTSLTEEQAVTGNKVLGPLDEAEGDSGAVAGPDEGPVNVDDGAGLRDGPDVEHGLVFGLDGRCVREDEHWWRSEMLQLRAMGDIIPLMENSL